MSTSDITKSDIGFSLCSLNGCSSQKWGGWCLLVWSPWLWAGFCSLNGSLSPKWGGWCPLSWMTWLWAGFPSAVASETQQEHHKTLLEVSLMSQAEHSIFAQHGTTNQMLPADTQSKLRTIYSECSLGHCLHSAYQWVLLRSFRLRQTCANPKSRQLLASGECSRSWAVIREIIECATESNSLLNWVQRIGNRGAEPLLWDVRSARSLFAKSAGKRGTINMHDFT